MGYQIPLDKPVDLIIVDARALQDQDYRYRGVGQHSAAILSMLRLFVWKHGRPRIIGLVDHRLDDLAIEHRALFDEVRAPGFHCGSSTWFICLSPMTHDPIWARRYLLDITILKIALFYDLIQLEFPHRYLPSLTSQVDFILNLAWLNSFDVFAAISRFSGDVLAKTMRIDRAKIFTSYVAVRPALEPTKNDERLPRSERRYILFAGGGDPRKNPECAILAHARSSLLKKAQIPLQIFGNYHAEARHALRSLYAKEGGEPNGINFSGHLSDEEMRQLYRHAIVTVVASYAEGFSIPIVESNASGTPAIASNVGAHSELLPSADHRFNAKDPDALRDALERLALQDQCWQDTLAAQKDLWKGFTVEEVGRRFVNGVVERYTEHCAAPAVKRRAQPELALLSPLPPAESGVADYSAATFAALAKLAKLRVFTDSENVEPNANYASLNSLRQAVFSARRADAVVSVLGNSHHHSTIFDFLLNFGGAAIAHDARMINFYVSLKGMERAVAVASAESDTQPDAALVEHWLHHQNELPILFLSEIANSAQPLIVHSPITAELIKTHYHVEPKTLPFAQYGNIDIARSAAKNRAVTREKLGIDENEIAICTFGYVSDDKAPDELVWATKMLNDWHTNAKLYFCGLPHPNTEIRLRRLINELKVADKIVFFDRFLSKEIYHDFLFAADAAVQLRTYFMGGLSGALNDCISAAMPSIANRHLAEAMRAPSFVRVITDNFTPILIAEAVLDILASGQNTSRPIEDALAFSKRHSVDVYAEEMLTALGLEVIRNGR